jgi:hypothetical protein
MTVDPDETTELPPNKDVRDLFEGLLGRDITIRPADDRVNVGPLIPTMEAVYVDDHMKTRAVAVMDMPLTARTAAAIGLMPPRAAEAAVEEGVLSEALEDNIAEVFNIMAALFNRYGAPQVRLYGWYPPGEAAPADVTALAAAFVGRTDLLIEIGGYGEGQLGLIIA